MAADSAVRLMLSLKDVLIGARQEAAQHNHYYIGVEHLFLAILESQLPDLQNAIQNQGVDPAQISHTLRDRMPAGQTKRHWAGYPHTPRTNVVLGIAHDLAAEAERSVTEREVIIAICEEGDSLPVRVMLALDLDLSQIMAALPASSVTPATSHIQLNVEIRHEHMPLLRKFTYPAVHKSVDKAILLPRQGAVYAVTPDLHLKIVPKIQLPDEIEIEKRLEQIGISYPVRSRASERVDDLAVLQYDTPFATSDSDARSWIQQQSSAELKTWLSDTILPILKAFWGLSRGTSLQALQDLYMPPRLPETINLHADFLIENDTIPVDGLRTATLPNPFMATTYLNGLETCGYTGDTHTALRLFHLVGDDGPALRYATTLHTGHQLRDLASLEIDLLVEHISILVGEEWDDLRYVLPYIHTINRGESFSRGKPALIDAFDTIQVIRDAIETFDESFQAYQTALAYVSMERMVEEHDLKIQRLLFLTAALAMHEAAR